MATLSKFVPPVAFHPGVTLAEKLKEMAMSVKEFAVRTSKPEKTVFAVIKGTSSVTPDMAVAFESVTRIPAHFWLEKQRLYDEYMARERREEQLTSAYQWARAFPFAQMERMGWVSAAKTLDEKVKSLFSFFQVSTAKAWEDYYLNQQLKVAFRISLSNIKEPHSISAWLREGELQAAEMHVSAFTEKGLRESIPDMKTLCARHPQGFAKELQNICGQHGVKLIYTPCLPKAPINGSTRWINDVPCIQITGRHKRNDIFWFTFFHELAHILLHGKKDIFLESADYIDKQQEKENAADSFAANLLLSQAEEAEVIKSGDFSAAAIMVYADKFNTHPGVIVGRLQHKRIIPYTQNSDLIEKIDLYK
ncbi:MAG: ImmA/IrrE family metallo-endopeptidase [Prevotellaceae bacterium]|nr:ImmA/IrrE family metallo-endopeptidase [Prevotellaceae bacterium]